MTDDLRERIAQALRDAMYPAFAGEPCGGKWPDYADAVLAVVQPIAAVPTNAETTDLFDLLREAEARVATLEAALRDIANCCDQWGDGYRLLGKIARTALARAVLDKGKPDG